MRSRQSSNKSGLSRPGETGQAKPLSPLRIVDSIGFWIVLLSVLVLVLYWPALHYGLSIYDDTAFVSGNQMVQKGLNLQTLWWAFTTFDVAHWHPLVWLSYLAEVSLFGSNPGLMHATNIVLHLLNTLILYLLLFIATGKKQLAGIVALLFAVHPMHVEAVAWLSARKDVLCTFFTLLALLAYIRYAQEKKRTFFYLSLTAYLMGMMSKSMIVTMPLLLLLLDFWPLGRYDHAFSTTHPLKKIWMTGYGLVREKTTYWLLTAIFCLIAFAPQFFEGAVSRSGGFDLGQRAAHILEAYAAYLMKSVWPVNLYVPYIQYQAPLTGVLVFIFSALLLMTIWSLVAAQKYPYLLFGWLWFIITLLPVCGIVPFGAHFMADRYTYFPHIGLFVMLVWYIREKASRFVFGRWILSITAVMICLLLSYTCWNQVGLWRNDERLFAHTISRDGQNYVAHYVLGNYFEVNQKDDDKALKHYLASVSLQPGYPLSQNSLGEYYWRKKEFEKAELHFKGALKAEERTPKSHVNLANCYILKREIAEAMKHLARALVLDPENGEAYNTLGTLLVAKGDYAQAEEAFQKALAFSPELEVAQINLEKLRAGSGRIE